MKKKNLEDFILLRCRQAYLQDDEKNLGQTIKVDPLKNWESSSHAKPKFMSHSKADFISHGFWKKYLVQDCPLLCSGQQK